MGAVGVAFYSSFDPSVGDAASGFYGPEQDLRAGGVTFTDKQQRVSVVASGIQVRRHADSFSAAADGETFGLFGSFILGTGLTLVVEAAESQLERPGLTEGRRGEALRVGLGGYRGTFSYQLDYRSVGADFTNLANDGLTSSGRSDRDSFDLSLGRSFEGGQANLMVQHVVGGDGSEVLGASLAVNRTISDKFGAAFMGTWAETTGEGDEALFLFPTDRVDWSASLTLNQQLGRLQLTETYGYQEQIDRQVDENASRGENLSVTASAPLGSGGFFNLSLTGYATDSPFGRIETYSISMQPSFTIEALRLTLQPNLAYSSSTGSEGVDSSSENYQMRLGWTPPGPSSALTFEVTGGWSRMRGGFGGDEDFVARYSFGIALGLDRQNRPRALSTDSSGQPSSAIW